MSNNTLALAVVCTGGALLTYSYLGGMWAAFAAIIGGVITLAVHCNSLENDSYDDSVG